MVVDATDVLYRYPNDPRPALDGLTFRLEAGARCLLLGRNGAGKTTLLQILAGKRMVPEERVRVLGRPAFHDTSLAGRVSLLGGRFPFDADIVVEELLPKGPRVDELVSILDVDRAWHMNRVSDGQRRRVQLVLGLARPVELLLLDEITTDLDLIARMDLLAFLRRESERGSTILYATHILDGLDDWATEVALMDRGRMKWHLAIDEVARPLLRTVETWLRELS